MLCKLTNTLAVGKDGFLNEKIFRSGNDGEFVGYDVFLYANGI